jgi:hypothetical protein
VTKPSNGAALQATDTPTGEKRRPGRPSAVTHAAQLEICARLAQGESLNKICKDKAMPSRASVMRALHGESPEFSEFRVQYARARDSLLDVYADQIIDIADDGTTDYVIKTGRNGHEYEAVDQEHIQRSRLRVEARKWILSKLKPETYGDKLIGAVEHQHSGRVDVTDMTEREKMRRFALFMMEDQRANAVDGEVAGPDDGTKSQKLDRPMMNDPQVVDDSSSE